MAAKSRRITDVEVSGPLFEIADIEREVKDVLREGIDELGAAGRDIAKSFAPVGSTGHFRTSINLFSSSREEEPFAVVRSTDYGRPYPGYPKSPPPLSTWLERGERKGVKIKKGRGIFTRAYRSINAIDKDTYFIGKLTERFGGDS
jgi:hypothetical protein